MSAARLGSLIEISVPESSLAPTIKAAAVALAAVVTAAAAQVSMPLPFTPVPLVFTPLAVLLTSAALGSRLGAAAQAVYLLAGIAGLPVFAPSATLPPGAARLFGPTGGYLMAYPLAAFVTGWLAERGWDRRFVSSVAAMLIGLAIIFTGGLSWLVATVTHSVSGAVSVGLRWFVVLDLLKILAGALVLPQTHRFFGRRSGKAGPY